MKTKTLKRLLRYIAPYRWWAALALACAAGGVGLSLLAPVLIGRAVDMIVGPGEVDFFELGPLLAQMAAVVAGSMALTWLTSLCTNRVSYRAARDLRRDAFAKLQRVPLKTIDANAHGDLISRVVNDVDQVSDGLLAGFAQLFTGAATIAGTLGFMLNINVPVALVVVCLTPLSFVVAALIAKKSRAAYEAQMAERGEIGAYAEEMISGQKTAAAFDYGKRAQTYFEEINARLYKSGVKSQFYSSITNPSTRFVNAIVYAGVGVFGAITAISGGISVGQLSSFLIYANQYTKPFNEISGVAAQMQSAFASAARVLEVIDYPEEAPDAQNAARKTSSQGNVEMENVGFSYVPGVKLIEGLSLTAKTGQRVAIVGPTGAGKSTLINLLMRFYDADSGVIRIDGSDIMGLTRDSLRGLFGMVLQETWLFEGSVRNNIAYGKPGASIDEIKAAAKAAGAHSFIRRLENGYDTVISGEGGLSEGQRQLLCIARVMLTGPPMLILDEATSSIDTRTEMKIQAAFDKMMAGRTSFVVAHRLSTIREADLILVMKDGAIIEQGTHAELLAKKGFYAGLWGSQFEGES